jgi:hypothetical protein
MSASEHIHVMVYCVYNVDIFWKSHFKQETWYQEILYLGRVDITILYCYNTSKILIAIFIMIDQRNPKVASCLHKYMYMSLDLVCMISQNNYSTKICLSF